MPHLSKLGFIASALILSACTFQMRAGMNANAGATTNNQQQARRPAQPSRRLGPTTSTPPPAATTAKPPTTNPPPSSVPTITGRNAFGNGTLGAFRGVAYVIPKDSQKLPDLSKLVPFAQLYTDSFIVQPQEFTAGFPGVLMQDEWFAIRYEGQFEIAREGSYKLKLTSDDGAILYVDGEKVIDNDGLHNPKEMFTTKTLKAGRHQLRLDYYQGNRGPVALQLQIGEASGTDTKPLVGVR